MMKSGLFQILVIVCIRVLAYMASRDIHFFCNKIYQILTSYFIVVVKRLFSVSNNHPFAVIRYGKIVCLGNVINVPILLIIPTSSCAAKTNFYLLNVEYTH